MLVEPQTICKTLCFCERTKGPQSLLQSSLGIRLERAILKTGKKQATYISQITLKPHCIFQMGIKKKYALTKPDYLLC